MIPTEQQRQDLTSKEFSALFLDGSPGLDIPYSDLCVGDKLGSGGFKDCYRGTYKGVTIEWMASKKITHSPFL